MASCCATGWVHCCWAPLVWAGRLSGSASPTGLVRADWSIGHWLAATPSAQAAWPAATVVASDAARKVPRRPRRRCRRGSRHGGPLPWKILVRSIAAARDTGGAPPHRACRRRGVGFSSLGWTRPPEGGLADVNRRRFRNYLSRSSMIGRTGGTRGWTVFETPSTPGGTIPIPSSPRGAQPAPARRGSPERRRVLSGHFASLERSPLLQHGSAMVPIPLAPLKCVCTMAFRFALKAVAHGRRRRSPRWTVKFRPSSPSRRPAWPCIWLCVVLGPAISANRLFISTGAASLKTSIDRSCHFNSLRHEPELPPSPSQMPFILDWLSEEDESFIFSLQCAALPRM
ncbi:hypothetical protein PVAP13_2KG488205 [Panicum virgatum]|uniref:Secreted protein n=1 Tax=Panicum virgatum TaxID=38727 RepID=A0A8T0WLU4_PANVG|nr:hypothetical protein PVAP13_2KG488205 [Panicum virgatum]